LLNTGTKKLNYTISSRQWKLRLKNVESKKKVPESKTSEKTKRVANPSKSMKKEIIMLKYLWKKLKDLA
jgi:hypothetical protein